MATTFEWQTFEWKCLKNEIESVKNTEKHNKGMKKVSVKANSGTAPGVAHCTNNTVKTTQVQKLWTAACLQRNLYLIAHSTAEQTSTSHVTKQLII